MRTTKIISAEPLLGTRDVAARCSMSMQAVREWEQRGLLPPSMREPSTGERIWRAADIETVLPTLPVRLPAGRPVGVVETKPRKKRRSGEEMAAARADAT